MYTGNGESDEDFSDLPVRLNSPIKSSPAVGQQTVSLEAGLVTGTRHKPTAESSSNSSTPNRTAVKAYPNAIFQTGSKPIVWDSPESPMRERYKPESQPVADSFTPARGAEATRPARVRFSIGSEGSTAHADAIAQASETFMAEQLKHEASFDSELRASAAELESALTVELNSTLQR